MAQFLPANGRKPGVGASPRARRCGEVMERVCLLSCDRSARCAAAALTNLLVRRASIKFVDAQGERIYEGRLSLLVGDRRRARVLAGFDRGELAHHPLVLVLEQVAVE